MTLFQRQESVVKKNRHQRASDNDFNVFHYYCPVCLWEKRTECKKIYVILVDKVAAWSSEAVILQREKSSGKTNIRGLGWLWFGLLCCLSLGCGADIETAEFSDRCLQGMGK